MIVSHEARGLLVELAVLYLDVITLFSASEEHDALRWKVLREDDRPQTVQVVLPLFQSVKGMPIGCEPFPADTADVRTLQPAFQSLQERFQAGRVVPAPDAGVLSLSNLDLLTYEGWDWVVAARLRSLPQVLEAKLFVTRDRAVVSEDAGVADLALKGWRLVLRRGKKRATRDASERDKIVAKLQRRPVQGIKGSGKRGRFLKTGRDAVGHSSWRPLLGAHCLTDSRRLDQL